jgi:hypothetical protein
VSMNILRNAAVAASVIGGAMLVSGGTPASAATLTPAFMHAGQEVNVQEVRHRWEHRPGRLEGERYWQPKNAPQYREPGYRFRGPAVGFGLGVPRGAQFTFGLTAPHGPAVGFGAPAPEHHYGPIHR